MLIDPNVPEELHAHFAHAASSAAQDIKHFTQVWEDPRSKGALETARDSKAKNEEDIRAWLVSEHADWLDVKEENASQGTLGMTNNDGSTDVKPTQWTIESIHAAVAKIKEAHPGIEASYEEDLQVVKARTP